jgi:hypothetical protein
VAQAVIYVVDILSPCRPKFNRRPLHMGFVMVEKVALRQVFSQAVHFLCHYHSNNAPYSVLHVHQ